tara:strand:+ start:4251 stop:4889 length:639 start_codon:yes stop_codon:yes gene_type:complete
MAYTTGALVTQIQNKLDDTSFSTSILKQFLNDTQREIFNMRMSKFVEATQDFSTVVSQDSIGTLPTNMQMVIDLRITGPAGYSSVLQYMDIQEFDARFPEPSLSGDALPYIWYPFGTTINVFPRPSQVLTLQLRYFKTPTELVNDADVPQIPEEFQELLVLGAFMRALEFNDNYDQAGIIKRKFDEMVDTMTKRYSPGAATASLMGVNRSRK